MNEPVRTLLQKSRTATKALSNSPSAQREQALNSIAALILSESQAILSANKQDLARAAQLAPAMRDRLLLTDDRVKQMAKAVADVAAQPDPLASRRSMGKGPSGINVYRQRVPLGVIAIVYEARPNVTAECAALAIKSGNAVVLRGGKEALASNQAIWGTVQRGLSAAGLSSDSCLLIEDPSRDAVAELLGATGLVDLVIPRGGAGLMALVDEHARVPVIRHGQGICHLYIDDSANVPMAVAIAVNAKMSRPGVCNAVETLLIHEACLREVLAKLGPQLSTVEIRADEKSRAYLGEIGIPSKAVRDEDFATEFLDLILAIRTVSNMDEALDHIAQFGTQHTASIVAEDQVRAERFLRQVDASCVLWNASTRLNDGGQLGLGAEMGVSTSKMHAYGPMGAMELTAEKFIVIGSGQIR